MEQRGQRRSWGRPGEAVATVMMQRTETQMLLCLISGRRKGQLHARPQDTLARSPPAPAIELETAYKQKQSPEALIYSVPT